MHQGRFAIPEVLTFGLGCFDHPSRFDTIGANDHFLGFAFVHCADILQIWIKSSLGNIVGMAHIVTHHWLFPTYFTDSRHDNLSINIFLCPSDYEQ
jgi:hypothetical protein